MEATKDGAEDGDSGGGRASVLAPYLRLMRVWGLWPYGPGGGRAAATAHWVYVRSMMFCQLVISVQQLLQMTMHRDLNNISSAVDVATLVISSLYRQARFNIYHKDFKRIAEDVDAKFSQHSMPHRYEFKLNVWLKRSKMYMYAYSTMPILLIAFWVISRNIDNINIADAPQESGGSLAVPEPNMTSTYNTRLVNRKFRINRKLPINCWYPFDTRVSPAFEIAFAWETCVGLYSGMAYAVSDLFLFMVIYLICGQLEILKTSLHLLRRSYRDSKLKLNNQRLLSEFSHRDKKMYKNMDEEVIKCVVYHCNIINLISDLDRILRSIIIVDFLHAVISLSFAMLHTIMANSLNEWVQMLMFIGVCVMHQFLNNFFAEFLIQQQEAVAEAVYDAPWVEGSATLRAAVTMTTAQARSPTKLSGWKMYVLGNSTFLEFMKLLASYFVVLQSLHAKEKQGSAQQNVESSSLRSSVNSTI